MYKDTKNRLRHIQKYFLVLAFGLCVMTFFFCQKKVFGHIEVHGRLINYMTQQPTTGKVELVTDRAGLNSQYGVLSVVDAKEDGTFSLNSKPAVSGKYFLRVDNVKFDIRAYPDTDKWEINVSANHKNDLGDIKAGDYTFICKIKIVPVSNNNSIWFFSEDQKSFTYYPPQTYATIIQTKKITYQYFVYEPVYRLSCRIETYDNLPDSYIWPNKTFNLPISGPDTLYTTINY